jgi:hypothetical protein
MGPETENGDFIERLEISTIYGDRMTKENCIVVSSGK